MKVAAGNGRAAESFAVFESWTTDASPDSEQEYRASDGPDRENLGPLVRQRTPRVPEQAAAGYAPATVGEKRDGAH